MKVKCDYCGSMIDEQSAACPNCGAALNGVNRFADKQPRTIEELREWYVSRRLPPEEVTRFFIGKDIREPRAFGIYRNSMGDFVVYKNKSNGQRAIRYQGTDEAYAVNELYQRLRAEIAEQKGRNSSNAGSGQTRNSGKKAEREGQWVVIFLGTLWSIMAVIMFLCILSILFSNAPKEGYYRYNDDTYYYQDSTWYYYNDLLDDWSHVDSSQVPDINRDTQEEYATEYHTGMQFEDSTWYEEDTYDDYDDYDDDWDSDYDWDSGDSWDSGGSDWDSDW